MRLPIVWTAVLFVLAAGASPPTRAQDAYPNRPIRIIVPYAPGGPIDLLRRYIRTGAFSVVLTHNRFSLIDQSAEPLFEEAGELGVAVLNAAPFGGGGVVASPPIGAGRLLDRDESFKKSTCDTPRPSATRTDHSAW